MVYNILVNAFLKRNTINNNHATVTPDYYPTFNTASQSHEGPGTCKQV